MESFHAFENLISTMFVLEHFGDYIKLVLNKN